MKKILLSLGTLAIVVVPITSVVACSSDDGNKSTIHKLKIQHINSTKTANKLAIVNIEVFDTSTTLAEKLGVAASNITDLNSSAFVYDAVTFTLTITSKTLGQTFINTLVIKPAVFVKKPTTIKEIKYEVAKTLKQDYVNKKQKDKKHFLKNNLENLEKVALKIEK